MIPGYEVVNAVLGELGKNGATSKTKLLKLLYLADLEHYRKHRTTLTGWRWRFHRFGPWAPEFDQVLEQLESHGNAQMKRLGGDREAILVIAADSKAGVESLRDADAQWTLAKVLPRWSQVDLPELLDYVYFETEPMKAAIRGEPLDFEQVSSTPNTMYRRTASDGPARLLLRVRERLNKISGGASMHSRSIATKCTSPKYDAEALAMLASQDDD